MIAANIPGKGLPWPDSFNALLLHYGQLKCAAAALKIAASSASKYKNGAWPRKTQAREAFYRFGWTDAELPESHWFPNKPTPEADARYAIFRFRYERIHYAVKDTTVRFGLALAESATWPIKDRAALEKWAARGKGGK